MSLFEALLLVVGGIAAGIVNVIAGGGSTLTVPLLHLAGVPGSVANGSNRVGILTSNAAAAVTFTRLGVKGLSHVGPILLPAVVGSLVGSIAISRVTDEAFETGFGLIMVPIIILSIRKKKVAEDAAVWSRPVTVAVFFCIGIYGGAIQAGVGLVNLAALTRAGFDLVTANHIKALVILAMTAVALPVFIWQGKVDWIPALVLAAGFTIGGWVGPKVTMKVDEKVVRAMTVVAAVALAGSLLGLY